MSITNTRKTIAPVTIPNTEALGGEVDSPTTSETVKALEEEGVLVLAGETIGRGQVNTASVLQPLMNQSWVKRSTPSEHFCFKFAASHQAQLKIPIAQ